MTLEQIFYGRSPDGYRILASSLVDAAISSAVETVCQAIGNPVQLRGDENQPYLVQKTAGDCVLMGCGRDGEKDSMGRRTQFYHFLVGNRGELREAGVSAADLFRKGGVFADRLPAGPVGAVEIDAAALVADRPAAEPKIGFPAVVSCCRARNLEILDLLGDRAVDGDWATFSWEPLAGCLVYGLDPWRNRLELPDEVMTYDVTGCAFPRVSAPASAQPAEPRTVRKERPSPAGDVRPRDTDPGSRWPLLAIALLAGLLAGYFACRMTTGDAAWTAPPKDLLTTEEFEASTLMKYGRNNPESKKLVDKLRTYVECVNRNVFNNQ